MPNACSLLFILLLYANCTHMSKDPIIIGHRGAMGHETENTIASVQKALDFGVDMIEIDVFRIASGEIVVFHDTELDRLSDAAGKIEEFNLSDLKNVKLDGNHRIPELKEVLKLVNNSVRLNIELKGAGTAQGVHLLTDHYVANGAWDLRNFIISSFNWDELKVMRELQADIPIAVLTDEDPIQAIPVAESLEAEAINPNYKLLTEENIRAMRDAGFKVYTWTVNRPEDIAHIKSLKVDGIITDYPERIH